MQWSLVGSRTSDSPCGSVRPAARGEDRAVGIKNDASNAVQNPGLADDTELILITRPAAGVRGQVALVLPEFDTYGP